MTITKTGLDAEIHRILAEMPAFPEGTWQGKKRKLDHESPTDVTEYIVREMKTEPDDAEMVEIQTAALQHAEMVTSQADNVFKTIDLLFQDDMDIFWDDMGDIFDHFESNEYIDAGDGSFTYDVPVKLKAETRDALIEQAVKEWQDNVLIHFWIAAATPKTGMEPDWDNAKLVRNGSEKGAMLAFCRIPPGFDNKEIIGHEGNMISAEALALAGVDTKTTITEAQELDEDFIITFANGNKLIAR